MTTPVLGTPASGTLGNCTVDGTDQVGFKNTPINSQSADYTLVLADAGKTILHPIADTNDRTITVPSNASVAFPVGTVIGFVNLTNSLAIDVDTDTLYLAGSGVVSGGAVVLASSGIAALVKLTSTSWMVSGNGVA